MAFITSTNYNRWLQARAGLCSITIMCVDIASRADVFISTKDEDGVRARRDMARYLRLLYTSIILTLTDASLWGANPADANTTETTKQVCEWGKGRRGRAWGAQAGTGSSPRALQLCLRCA